MAEIKIYVTEINYLDEINLPEWNENLSDWNKYIWIIQIYLSEWNKDNEIKLSDWNKNQSEWKQNLSEWNKSLQMK